MGGLVLIVLARIRSEKQRRNVMFLSHLNIDGATASQFGAFPPIDTTREEGGAICNTRFPLY